MIDLLISKALDLADGVATEIAKKAGIPDKMPKEVAAAFAKAWVKNLKAEVTAARERAKKRIAGKG